MGQGAAAGAALGSVVGPWGTAIGGVVGAGAGLIGGAIEDGNIAEEQARALEEQKAGQGRERESAWNKLMLQEAAARGANPTALRVKQYELGMQDMELAQKQERAQTQKQFDAYNETDPSAFVGIAQAGTRIGQGMYNAYSTPSATVEPSSFRAMPAAQVTPGAGTGAGLGGDIGTSPEVQDGFDAQNFGAISRRGQRYGF